MQIIGYGSAARGDDAAGLLVARRLRRLGLPAVDVRGDATELLLAWEGADDVVVVDATVTGAPPGTVRVWNGRASGWPACARLSSHGMGLAEALELARSLGRLPARLRVYGIEAGRARPGSGPSRPVRRAIADVVRRIAAGRGVLGGRRRAPHRPSARRRREVPSARHWGTRSPAGSRPQRVRR